MIARSEMMPLMLQACPSFDGEWRRFLQAWSEAPELPLYLALGDLARHLIERLARRDVSTFPAVFAIVERWIVEGTPYVREAAIVGLLEDLQNGNLHAATQPDAFRPYLLPVSARWWDKLIGFWERGALLRDA